MQVKKFTELQKLKSPILVTGHTGFKGAWLSVLLNELNIPFTGYSLKPYSNSLYSEFPSNVMPPQKYADIRNLNSVRNFIRRVNPLAVIHLAAQPLVLESYNNPLDTFLVNAMGTANILDVCYKHPTVKSILVVTTDKVYLNENKKISFTESDALKGHDPYSSSKVAVEAVVNAWQKLQSRPDLKIVTVRAGNVIGGGDFAENRLIPDLVRAVKNKSNIEIRNPQSTRPWQHALDPLYGYLLYLNQLISGGVKDLSLNFGPTEASLDVLNVARRFLKYLDFNGEIIIGHDKNIKNELEAKNLHLDSTRAKEILGWRPVWNQEEAIRITAEWWKSILVGSDHYEETRKQVKQYLNTANNLYK